MRTLGGEDGISSLTIEEEEIVLSADLAHKLVAVNIESLRVFEQNLLTAAVMEFSGPAVGVAGDALGGFKGAVNFQKICDAGGSERVRGIVSWQSCMFEPSLEHVLGVGWQSDTDYGVVLRTHPTRHSASG